MHPTTLLTKTTTYSEPAPDPIARPPEQAIPSTWTVTTVEGITLTGHQPGWSMDNPSQTGITLDQAVNYLRGYAHYAMLPVDPVLPPATLDINGTRTPTSVMFAAQIACHPYSGQPHEHTPTASLTIVEEWDFECLAAADLARFATQLRIQADLFEKIVSPALAAAREDRTAHHPTTPTDDQTKDDLP